jgi:hypothetical protein
VERTGHEPPSRFCVRYGPPFTTTLAHVTVVAIKPEVVDD